MTTQIAQSGSARKRLTTHEIAEIRALRAAGHSISQICAKTGRVRNTVHRHARDVKLPNGPLKRGPKRNMAKRAIAVRLHREGLTFDAIASRLQVPKSTVYYAVKGRAV